MTSYSLKDIETIKLKTIEYDTLNDKYKLFNDLIDQIEISIVVNDYKEVSYKKNNYNNQKFNNYNNQKSNNQKFINYNNQKSNNYNNQSKHYNKNIFSKLNRKSSSNQNQEDYKNQHRQEFGHSALRNRLNKTNKEYLLLNGEINKLTESNIDTII